MYQLYGSVSIRFTVRNADGSIKMESGRKVYDSNQTNFVRPSVIGNAVRDNEYNRSKTFKDIFQGQWDAQITPIEGLVLDANLNVFVDNMRWNVCHKPVRCQLKY